MDIIQNLYIGITITLTDWSEKKTIVVQGDDVWDDYRHPEFSDEVMVMVKKCENEILRIGVVVCLAFFFLVSPVMAATTELTITKYAIDGSTILNQTTKNYAWLEANLPVKGDGVTHYFHQGPTFNETDPYDPGEWQNVLSRDFGAVKGTDVKDLCGLVGGAHKGDAIRIRADDGLTLTYPYEYVYTPDPRQGPMVITWYNGEESKGGYELQGTGYPPSYFKGMRLIMFADTSSNPWGYHVFGNNDMLQVWAPQYRYNFSAIWPSSGGISEFGVRYINIMSRDPVPVAPVAAFSGTPTTGTAPLTVQFSGSATGTGPFTYAWDFTNDGVTDSTTQNPSHIYPSAGTYSVNLTVTGPGGSDSETKTNYITVTAVIVKTPSEMIQDTIEQIKSLPLKQGIENSLTAKLNAAIKSLEKGNTKPAKNQLDACINEIAAQKGKAITEEQAATLTASIIRINQLL